jgi:hypothetical protein
MESADRYAAIALIGRTHAGTVWRARDRVQQRDVVLRQIGPPSAQALARLRAEVATFSAMPHGNVISVVGLVESPSEVWLVQEWVDGAALATVLPLTGPLTGPQAAGVIRGVLSGLAAAERNGLTHGGIAPSTVVLDRSGTSRLADFGLWATPGGFGLVPETAYLSPEVAGGAAPNARSDVYSTAALMAALLRTDQPDGTAADQPMWAIVQRGLARDPGDRFANAADFLAALDDAATRSYGGGWLNAAGMSGVMSALGGALAVAGNLTAQAGGESGPWFAPSGGPAGQHAPTAMQVHHASIRARGEDTGTTTTSQRRPRRIRPRHAAVGASVAVVVAAAAVVGIVIARHDKPPPTPVAAAVKTTTPPLAAFDLHTVDWNSATVPGNACMSTTDITLSGGEASIPTNIPNSSYLLRLSIAPQYVQLTNGPAVAAFGLTCLGVGGVAGSHVAKQLSIAVFDAPQGKPTLLRLITNFELGLIQDGPGANPTGFVPDAIQPQAGTLLITGTYLRTNDPACCATGHGQSTISYRDQALVWTPAGPITASTSSSPPSSSSTGDGGSQSAATAAVQAWYARATNNCRAHPPGNSSPQPQPSVPPSAITVTWSQFTAGQSGAGQAGDRTTGGPGQFTVAYRNGTWTTTARFDFC